MLLIASLIHIYTLILFAAVIITWLPIERSNPIRQFLELLTEPVLKPVRKLLPDMGGLDLSPIIVLIGLQVLRRFLLG